MKNNKIPVISVLSAILIALIVLILICAENMPAGWYKNRNGGREKSEDNSTAGNMEETAAKNTTAESTGVEENTAEADLGVTITFQDAIVLKKNTDIYNEPDQTSSKAGRLTINSVIRNFESKNDEWYYVEYNGLSGYAKKTDCGRDKTYYIPQDIKKADPVDNVIRELDAAKPMIALTFDDGPGSFTDKILDSLERNRQRAGFFVIGKNIPGREETLKRAYSLGCMIGNHTYNHTQLTKLSNEDIVWQINACNQLIRKLIPQEKIPFRAPYCAYNDNIRKIVSAPFIHWSIDTLDWKVLNSDKVYEKVMTEVKDGDVILMHDVLETSAEAAVRIIDDLTVRGYQLVTVYELAYYRGVTLEDGEVYKERFMPTEQQIRASKSSQTAGSGS